jgi:hypothetical protein
MITCSVLLTGCISEEKNPQNINPHHHKRLLSSEMYSIPAGKYTYKSIYLDPFGKYNYTIYGEMTLFLASNSKMTKERMRHKDDPIINQSAPLPGTCKS